MNHDQTKPTKWECALRRLKSASSSMIRIFAGLSVDILDTSFLHVDDQT